MTQALLTDDEMAKVHTKWLLQIKAGGEKAKHSDLIEIATKAQLKKAARIYREENPSLYKKYPHFWEQLLREVE